MRLVDTHCHLDLPDYKDDLGAVLERAYLAGVERIIIPGISVESTLRAAQLAKSDPRIFFAAGIHPHDADKVSEADIGKLREIAVTSDKIVAIGEVGLDHYKGFSSPENQRWVFRELVRLSAELDLPLVVHNREAAEDLLKILDEWGRGALKGVMHCFSGDDVFLEKMLARDFYVSFAGNITYEKAGHLRQVAKKVPPEKLLLETDSPYLTPEPDRGKRNEPANVRRLIDLYADIHGLSTDDIARITTHNANQLFRLGIEKASTAAYSIRDSIYINSTYRCTNRCGFCTRTVSDYVKGYNLKLDKEPSAEEIIQAMGDMSRYGAVVFCGFGEPTLRLGTLKAVAAYAKTKGKEVRLITNGEGDLILGRPMAPELKGLVDKVSVSLNAPNDKDHDNMCHSVFGRDSYGAILGFIKACGDNAIAVEVTCLDVIGEKAVAEVERKARECGAEFRLRHLDVVG